MLYRHWYRPSLGSSVATIVYQASCKRVCHSTHHRIMGNFGYIWAQQCRHGRKSYDRQIHQHEDRTYDGNWRWITSRRGRYSAEGYY
ncbi:uncharacterized protein BDW43DRAFT_263008, partial [Aspergillus alliaceus]